MQDSEKMVYYDIITKCWNAFKCEEACADEFSDFWWTQKINRFDDIREEFANTDYADMAGRMTQIFLDEHERRQKNGKKI